MKETMIETEVTYTLEYGGRFYLIEHVPARICRETGEQYFAPETVEHIQSLFYLRMFPDVNLSCISCYPVKKYWG